MKGLPDSPAYSFALPSLHDDTALDCRVYLPSDLSRWHAKAAVLAHPYAPLGGSYDDPVLDGVASELLAGGWSVGMFNFSRGAGGSAGHTSWTGRPELSDYITVAGFMAHFMNEVQPKDDDESEAMKLLLGGYSYGSLIVARLPSTQDILSRFADSEDGSPAARVLLRAQSLAAQTVAELQDWQEAQRQLHDNATPTTQDDKKGGTHAHTRSPNPSKESDVHLQVQTSYLLVSPLLLPTSLFIAPALLRLRAAESELTKRRTLAVFGGHDLFTSGKRLRPWAMKLAEESGGRFQWEEVEVAGHFWHEKGAMRALRERVRRWVDGL
ncbi:hypothetical protein K490DRAFT_37912 [Saccharata proteae CBS 121410]|uniref:AB hydrolase-1 domain-containing protein n=1 Tax=Saccharata proteae CBS 121410 TaxID=1314787 RepID=A0A6A5YBC6_9PEZI|nr:hypothetical protein K490DRAFT_37912 [Saccharata proteae CBS 121410]